jgi:hypothetical protein
MTLPIPSNVFADGELTNEVKWYQRIFTAINTIYTSLTSLQASTLTGTTSATTSASGIVNVSHSFGVTPSYIGISFTSPNVGVPWRISAKTSSTFQVVFYSVAGGSTGYATQAVTFDWYMVA